MPSQPLDFALRLCLLLLLGRLPIALFLGCALASHSLALESLGLGPLARDAISVLPLLFRAHPLLVLAGLRGGQ